MNSNAEMLKNREREREREKEMQGLGSGIVMREKRADKNNGNEVYASPEYVKDLREGQGDESIGLEHCLESTRQQGLVKSVTLTTRTRAPRRVGG